MPKAKASQVIIHRIEFQESERRLLELAVGSWSARNVTKGIFNLTSDLTTVVMLIIIYEWITDKTILDETILAALALGTAGTGALASALADNWYNYRQTEEYRGDYYERAGSVAGGLRNLLDNLIGLFTGEYLQRFHDAQQENSSSGGGGGF